MARRAAEVRLTDERRALAERHWHLTLKLIRPSCRRHPRLTDEFASAAGLELVRLIGRMKPGYETQLAKWLGTRIPGACIDVLRRETKRPTVPLPDDLEARP